MAISRKITRSIFEKLNEANAPFYIYSTTDIASNCKTIQKIPYKNKSIHFATMANSNPEFIRIVKQNGLNIFVNSTPHLQLAHETGYKEKEIVFTSSAMDIFSMQKVNESNAYINLDSLNQIKLWEKHFKHKKFGIRCNINGPQNPANSHAGHFIGANSRLGLTTNEIKSIYNKHLVNGLHLYIGTDLFDIEYFIDYYEILAKLGQYFPKLEYLDFGGGFGIDDYAGRQFNFEEYGKRITELMNYYSNKYNRNIKLILEPGRIIGGKAGYFVCKVTDVKSRNSTQIIGTNASSVQFPRPLFYPDEAIHPITVISKNGTIKKANGTNTTIVGCSTYSRDYLAKEQNLPEAEIGDIVIFSNAGSYCSAAYTNFLGFPKPSEYFV